MILKENIKRVPPKRKNKTQKNRKSNRIEMKREMK